MINLKYFLGVMLLAIAVIQIDAQSNRIEVNGQAVFISGMNMAWNHFAFDMTNFDEVVFTRALDEIAAAGGMKKGILDFYMVHYYAWGKTELSPFHHPASYWELDKPLVIGEFSAKGPYNDVDKIQAYELLYENGYAGGLAWTWSGHDGNGGVTEATPGMMKLLREHPKDIKVLINKEYVYPE